MTAKRRIRRKPEDAEREILDAAEALLKEIRFRDLTVDAVAAAANMRRSNFYNYFKDRNELVMRLVDRIAGEMFAATRFWLENENPDRVAALRQGLRDVARIWSRHADVLAAMNEASHHDEAAQRYFRGGVVQQYIDQIAKLIRQREAPGPHESRQSQRGRARADHSQCQLHDGARHDGPRPPGCGCVRAGRDLGCHAVSRRHLSGGHPSSVSE